MNTVQIECFLSVAAHLNFARASEHLNLSQPAVTHQIQSLEAELGVKLFNRSTRTVELTMEGQAFLDDARSILHISERAKAKFSDSGNAEMLAFNIGCVDLSQIGMLDGTLGRMRELYPNMHPSFRQLPRGMLFPKLEDGAIDVAFGLGEDTTNRKLIRYQELVRTPLCCICPAGHPLSGRRSVTVDDLNDHNLIIHNPGGQSPGTTAILMRLTGKRHLSDIYHNEQVEDALVLVRAGFGISIQPGIFVPASTGMTVIPITDMDELSFGVYSKEHTEGKMVRTFIRTAIDEFSKMA